MEEQDLENKETLKHGDSQQNIQSNKTEIKKACGYVRISEEDRDPDKKTSIDNQIEMIHNCCAQRGWHLVNIYEDRNLSGGDRFRKGFGDMIRCAIRYKQVQIIIVKDQSRFCRDVSFFLDSLKDLEAHGIKVFSILKRDFLSPDDLVDVITSVTNNQDIIKQRRYTKELYDMKKQSGEPPFLAPYGYKNKNKKWMINEKETKIVQIVCMDYVSNIKVSETLDKLKISKSLYYRIIRNTRKGVYGGYIVYFNKTKDSNGKIIRKEEVRYRGSHKPIIFEEVYNKLAEKYDKQISKENFRVIMN